MTYKLVCEIPCSPLYIFLIVNYLTGNLILDLSEKLLFQKKFLVKVTKRPFFTFLIFFLIFDLWKKYLNCQIDPTEM
jgi:hypothetical protein